MHRLLRDKVSRPLVLGCSAGLENLNRDRDSEFREDLDLPRTSVPMSVILCVHARYADMNER